MRKYLFTISAHMEGQTVLNFYNLDTRLFVTEEELVEAFKEFYPRATEVRVRSFRENHQELFATVAA